MAGKRFSAKFDGKCKSCFAEIYEGDTIAFSTEEQGQILCEPCADAEDEDTVVRIVK